MKIPAIPPGTLSWPLLALIASGWASVAAAVDARRPNILLIVSDDMGFADVGFTGSREIPTPHLDALAGSGMRFTDAYVSAPYCSPSRAGFMTGRYQQRFGFEFNPKAKTQGLPSSEVTLGDYLKRAGYVTGFIGKWGLGDQVGIERPRRIAPGEVPRVAVAVGSLECDACETDLDRSAD